MTGLSSIVPSLVNFRLDDLAPFTKEQVAGYDDSADFRVYYAGRDDVHGILLYLLNRCTRSLRFNMFGYDDDELNGVIVRKIKDENVYVQGTLDRGQAGGLHEKQILAGWDQQVRNSFVIEESPTGQIAHTKGGVIDGLVAFEGSTNWSASGEGINPAKAQNNTLSVYVHPFQIARFTDELDYEHTNGLRKVGAAPSS